ncbi:MAG TPA: NAD-dependent epimerase/dehydratase family protein [Kiloniellales bacterium]|nr:NAD-dependent epimerase/dehydratase family protein [Kiloniellales bacterium]
MTILLTGAAGFIGYHVAEALLGRGEWVVGLDSLTDYYDPALKRVRRARLERHGGFVFHEVDIAERPALESLISAEPGIDRVVHLAAQAGVRYSLENPDAYLRSNVAGQLAVLEACRRLPKLEHLVYASSSSVYGGNHKLPFAVEDRVDRPVSLYAATKRAGELMAHTYAHLFGLPATGLRFFTVYGPWGRPDMAYYSFTRAIFEGTPIRVFNRGDMKRDFTEIDDIVAGVLAALERPPAPGDADDGVPHRLYNLGNHRAEPLLRFIEVLERTCGREAEKILEPMQSGDVRETYADITGAARDLGFAPKTTIEEGLPRFVAWFRDYHGV